MKDKLVTFVPSVVCVITCYSILGGEWTHKGEQNG